MEKIGGRRIFRGKLDEEIRKSLLGKSFKNYANLKSEGLQNEKF